MEDKRITKTKRALKSALLELLTTQAFDVISITELCKIANVTGEMKVELLDPNNKVIEGFSKDECKAFKGDNVKAKIEWTGNASLASLKNKQLKVKFYIDNGEIFAFWISPSANGESMGYTAGGGPGLNISGIDKTN